ncbi:MAG TPA: transketolase [Bacteroidota bacterium]|nr:transketolase [Bacteroidota bacterium]
MNAPLTGIPEGVIPRDPSLSELDELCINTIRCLAMDAVQKAKAGHPGMPMGMAPAAYVLWTEVMRYNPANPKWANRDRFVLSAGHGCMLLYSLLHLTGYDLALDELKNFRQWGSRTPGHPEYGHTPGVEVTTGPLGQGISNAVGMAIAGKYLAHRYNREDFRLLSYRIYVVAGDGCMMEGVSSEACSLAGHLKLDNLIVVYDDNHISIDGSTSIAFSEDVAKRFEAYGWFVQTVGGDGNDMRAFRNAVGAAKKEHGRPSLIKLRTHIGFGSPHKQDTAEAHGQPLGDEEIALTKKRYGWDPEKKFYVPPEVASFMGGRKAKGEALEKEWNDLFARYASRYPAEAEEFRRAASRQLPADWEKTWRESVPAFDPASPIATREAQGKLLDQLMPKLPLVIGGSADLTPSNNTRFKGAVDFTPEHLEGRYVRYGVREHAMGAVMNGIAVSDMLIPYGGTFFVFSDYMRPTVRLAALSKYPVIFDYTHDSIGLGEDGPTHQAVEHLAALRAMPGLVMLRPSDATETVAAWKFALEHRSGPVAIALTRQKVPVIDRSKYPAADNLAKGAYVLSGPPKPAVILIGTGSEVSLALAAAGALTGAGISVRVVSMPSWELFEQQDAAYRESVLPAAVRARVAVEAGVRLGWDRYIGPQGGFVGMSSYGASAPAEAAFKGFGITADAVIAAARKAMQ